MRMNVSSTQATNAALQGVQATTDAKRAGLQMQLLKKSLNSQQEQTMDLMRMMEGKGNVIDIQV